MRLTVDTNILVHAQERLPGRPELARTIVDALPGTDIILTMQVLGEFLNVVRRKNAQEMPTAIRTVALWTTLFPIVATHPDDLIAAALLAQEHRLQFWDSLILTVARTAGAETMLTEDMQDGAEISGIRLVDPFNPANHEIVQALLTPAPGTA